MIKIVGLGPGAPEALTYGAIKALEDSDNLFFRTEKHPTVDYLKEKLNGFNTCDNYYETSDSFDEVYEKGLKVMDMTAFTLSHENKLPIIVFDMNKNGNLLKIVEGENIGTLVNI